MEIRISKAKLTKSGCLEAVYVDQDGNEITIRGKNHVHPDLKVALNALVPFFADLTEQKEADRIDWTDLGGEYNDSILQKIEVTGVSRGTDENDPVVTMTGKRILITRKVLNLNSPAVEMASDAFEWEHLDEFDMRLSAFFYECEQYIVARKWSVLQQELVFEGNPDDPFSEAASTDGVPIGEASDIVA